MRQYNCLLSEDVKLGNSDQDVPGQSDGADLLLRRSGNLLNFRNEKSFDDHREQVRLDRVAGLDQAGPAEPDDVEAHEGDEVLHELGRL